MGKISSAFKEKLDEKKQKAPPLRKDFPRSGGRCRAVTKGGIWQRRKRCLRGFNNKRSIMDNSSPKIYTEFLPISRADMEARGWEQLDFVVVGGDAMWTTPALALPSSAVCWKPRAIRSACWPSHATPTARTSSGSASRSTASSSAAATWTAWSATIPWQRFPAPRTNTPPAARAAHARTAAPPCTPALPSRPIPTCR